MMLKEIEQKKEYLNSLRPFTEDESEYIKEYVIRLNTRSNPRVGELEGISNVYSCIDYIMREESSFPYPKGYRHPLTEAFLQNFNRTILEHCIGYLPCEKGFYRLGEGNDKIGDVVLPDREIFIPRLQELIKWYSETDCDLINKLAIFHLRFLCDIHPFFDGNGRTARAFMNLELAREGYPMIGLKYSDPDAYENVFDSYNNHDEEPMKKLILKNINTQLDKQISFKRN